MKELLEIQRQLVAPKDKYGHDGQYVYRTAEDIIERVKPLLVQQNCELIMTDRVEEVGGRLFLHATARLVPADNSLGNTPCEADGWAEIPAKLAGMSAPQITGSCSSYARKYALGGLFAIDGNTDPDAIPLTDEQTDGLKAAILAASSTKELTTLWRRLPKSAQKDVEFTHRVALYKEKLTKNEKD